MRTRERQTGMGGGLAAILILLASSAGAAGPDESAMAERSLRSEGDLARVWRGMEKARAGQPVTVAVIGGSITQGAMASKPDLRYGEQVAAWWRRTFPRSTITFVNAGIGATGSNYGALRAPRDLLSKNPDFVVVEFAVNDGGSEKSAETLEGLVRQILRHPNQPAVMLLFMVNRGGGSAQDWFVKVGEHYRLPMVSYRDAVWPEIQAGRLAWTDISPDEVHPNDRGHTWAAEWIARLLQKALDRLPASSALPAPTPMPAPRFSARFETTVLQEATALQPAANTGWTYDAAKKAWISSTPGSSIEFEIEGTTIFSMHFVLRAAMGRARVTVDGGPPKALDAWFSGTWGGYRQTNELARDLPPGRHRVRFELLPDKNAESTGHEFRILGLGAAG